MLSDGKRSFTYDAANRLSHVTTQDGNTQVNRYDGEGLRAEMEENGRLVQFLFDGDKVVAETDCEGTNIRYIRGYELISSDCEKARTYYHYASDELGSITHITDEAGNVCNHYEYDAFGDFTVREETVANRFGFTGEQYDPVAGLYYLRARFYNPVIGRFIQEDTYYGDGLNLYAYCGNNPVRYVDPSGFAGEICADKQATISYIAKEEGISLKKAEKKYNEYRNKNADLTPEQIRENITGTKRTPREGTPKPGDYDYEGELPDDSWILSQYGAGAHLVERSNVKGRPDLDCYDQSKTPRFYPYGTPENAGQAHLRIHESTRTHGIDITGGNPDISSPKLLEMYDDAYFDPMLDGIRGDLRNPSGTTIIAVDVTPGEAYMLLLEWGSKQKK